MNKQTLFLTLTLLSASTVHQATANPFTDLYNLVKNNHLDTAAAFSIPAALMYKALSTRTVADVRAQAEAIVAKDQSGRGILTVADLNHAYWVVDDATDEDIERSIALNKYLVPGFTGLIAGLFYSALRYGDANRVHVSAHVMVPLFNQYAARRR